MSEMSATVSGRPTSIDDMSGYVDNQTQTVLSATVIGSSMRLDTFSPADAFILFIGALGVAGNLFACIVFIGHEPLRKRIPNLFLINQSVLDLVVGAMLIVTTFLTRFNMRAGGQSSGIAMCYIVNTRILFIAPLLSSTWNLSAMTLERYAEVVHPIKHKLWISRRKLYLLFAVIWVAGYLYKAFSVLTVTAVVGDVCSVGGQQTRIGRLINSFTTVLIEFACPLAVITFSYVRLFQATRNLHFNSAAQPIASCSNQRQRQQQQQQPTISPISQSIRKIMTIIVAILIVSLGPKQICLLLYASDTSLIDLSGLMYNIFVFINYANCCCNPVIYLFKYEEFRRGVRVVILRKKNVVAISASVTHAARTVKKAERF